MSTTSAQAVRGLCGALIGLTTLTTGLRFFSRRLQDAKIGPDDWVVIPAWVIFTAMAICVLVATQWHFIATTTQEAAAAATPFPQGFKAILAMDVAGCLNEGFTRISALLFFRRIFCVSGRSRKLRLIIYASIVLLVIWMIVYSALPLLQCGPNLAVIDNAKTKPLQYCSDAFGVAWVESFAITDAIMEAALIALPVPLVLGLQTSIQRRLAVLLVFATAFVSLGAGIARLVISFQALKPAGHGQVLTPQQAIDETTTIAFLWVMSGGVALITINLPSLYWMLHKIKPERVLYSIRSALSLSSLRGRTTDDPSSPKYTESPSSYSKTHDIARTVTIGVESNTSASGEDRV